MLIVITLQIQGFLITASKHNLSEKALAQEIKTYWLEANYPEDEDIEIIRKDLTDTLELEECLISKISLAFAP